MNKIVEIVIQLAVVLFAISVHESAHAWMADKFGDSTAKDAGRVSLNPIVHIDPIGTVIFPLLLALMGAPVFGWAKPVMVNPYNLREPRKANILISAAGPVSNLLGAAAGMVLFLMIKKINIGLLFGEPNFSLIGWLLVYLIIINIYLAVFNLIPIPPLDGSGILEGILQGDALYYYRMIKPYGFIILIVIIYVGALDKIANPIITTVFNILLRG
jgi:Zn-dependent protease